MRIGTAVAFGLLLVGCGPSFEPVVASPTSSANPTPVDEILAQGFVTLGQREGVTVYRRDKLPGFEFAAEGDIPATPERVRKVLLDYPAHQSWQEHLRDCKVIGQGEDWIDVYERLGLPVIEDRDYTLHVTFGSDNGVLWTKFETANPKGPAPVDGVVRVYTHTGGWRLTPTNGGAATHAFYRFHLDIDSSMSDMMGTGQAETDIVHLFTQIKEQLPKYP